LRPEKLAEPADERWDDVYAEIEKSEIFKNCWSFRIQVRFEGQLYTSRIVVPEEDFKYLKFDIYTYTLDRMVEKIDELLERGI
jgi:hypothetical protein